MIIGRSEAIGKVKDEFVKRKRPVSDYYSTQHEELKVLQGLDLEYIPTSFEMADYYHIEYSFIKLKGHTPSYLSSGLSPGLGKIYISDRYSKNSYEARILCAHELGHYFLHSSAEGYEMNDINDSADVITEYEANVFTILLMPQILAGQSWEKYSFEKVNRLVYEAVMKSK